MLIGLCRWIVEDKNSTRCWPEQDWKSGDKAWVIALFGGGDAMVADRKAQVFKDRELRALVVKEGKREVRSI